MPAINDDKQPKCLVLQVFVCPCLATLYFAEGISGDSVNVEDWKPAHIGIPVIIYDTGDGKRTRGLSLVFAEKVSRLTGKTYADRCFLVI